METSLPNKHIALLQHARFKTTFTEVLLEPVMPKVPPSLLALPTSVVFCRPNCQKKLLQIIMNLVVMQDLCEGGKHEKETKKENINAPEKSRSNLYFYTNVCHAMSIRMYPKKPGNKKRDLSEK